MRPRILATLTLAAAALPVIAEPVTYRIDPNHTFVHLESRHFGVSTNRGRFDKKEGSVTLDRAAKTGRAEITIETDSLNTGVPHFTSTIKGKDVLNVAEFPTAKFVGDQFTFDGDKVVSVGGQLTMAGKTAPVRLAATSFGCFEHPMLKREVCGGDFEATIQRSQWGISFARGSVPDDVRLLIQIEAIRQ